MPRIFIPLILLTISLAVTNDAQNRVHGQTVVVDFDELDVFTDATASGSFYDGYGQDAAAAWTSGGIRFSTQSFGPGFSYSNVDDVTTAGFTNQHSAITGRDVSGDGNYALLTTDSRVGSAAFFDTDGLSQPESIFVTNATYPYLYITEGRSPPLDPPGPYGDQDFFTLRFTGFDDVGGAGQITGIVDFDLADYRFADDSLDFAIDQWQNVDLTGLGLVRSVGIGFDSARTSTFGNDTFYDTPVYAAFDNLVITAVPEPALAFWGIGLVAAMPIRRRMSRRWRRSSTRSAV